MNSEGFSWILIRSIFLWSTFIFVVICNMTSSVSSSHQLFPSVINLQVNVNLAWVQSFPKFSFSSNIEASSRKNNHCDSNQSLTLFLSQLLMHLFPFCTIIWPPALEQKRVNNDFSCWVCSFLYRKVRQQKRGSVSVCSLTSTEPHRKSYL